MEPTLDVLISTIDDGINQIPNVVLNKLEGIHYIVSHQLRDHKFMKYPEKLIRSDITISQIFGFGVTKSRNNAISLASGDIGLFSDDDVTYSTEYFKTIRRIFHENPILDVALFKVKTPSGTPEYRRYPLDAFKIKKLPYSIGTIEIAFRIESIKREKILFDERFGAGQPLLIGSDESIFIHDCIRAGLNVWFFPEYVVNHPFESTSKLLPKFDKRRASVSGAYDARIYGLIAIPKAFLYVFKHFPLMIRNKKNPFGYLKDRLSAALYILLYNSNT